MGECREDLIFQLRTRSTRGWKYSNVFPGTNLKVFSCKTTSQEERFSNWLNKPLHLVTILFAPGSSDLFKEIEVTVYIQLQQVRLQLLLLSTTLFTTMKYLNWSQVIANDPNSNFYYNNAMDVTNLKIDTISAKKCIENIKKEPNLMY